MSIWWNGISSDDVGVVVEHYPALHLPERKTNFYTVGGRSGDVVRQKCEWRNYTQAYDIYFKDDTKHLQDAAHRVAEWLYSGQGYCKLEDSYELGVYREAVFLGGFEIENTLNRFGRVTIEFNCKPYKYLNTGDRWIDLTNATEENPVLINSGVHKYIPCHPYIVIDAEAGFDIKRDYSRIEPIPERTLISGDNTNQFEIENPAGIYEVDTESGEIVEYDWDISAPYTYASDEALKWDCYDGYYFIRKQYGQEDSPINKVKIKPRWFVL